MKSYYPDTNSDRADWWQNIATVGNAILAAAGFSADEIASIMADAAWGVYLYRTLRNAYEEATMRVIGYANAILDGPNGNPTPDAPVMPTWPPAPPLSSPLTGIEARRDSWVSRFKKSPGYLPETVGQIMRVEAASSPFDPGTFISSLFGLSSPTSKQLRFKFSKAYGQIDGVNLYGHKTGATTDILIGRFTAIPGNATIPLVDGSPEEWDFYSVGVKRDVEIGQPSPTMTQIIRP